jgi:hypothetical protein
MAQPKQNALGLEFTSLPKEGREHQHMDKEFDILFGSSASSSASSVTHSSNAEDGQPTYIQSQSGPLSPFLFTESQDNKRAVTHEKVIFDAERNKASAVSSYMGFSFKPGDDTSLDIVIGKSAEAGTFNVITLGH